MHACHGMSVAWSVTNCYILATTTVSPIDQDYGTGQPTEAPGDDHFTTPTPKTTGELSFIHIRHSLITNYMFDTPANLQRVSKSFISIVTKYADGYNNKKYRTINEEIQSEWMNTEWHLIVDLTEVAFPSSGLHFDSCFSYSYCTSNLLYIAK